MDCLTPSFPSRFSSRFVPAPLIGGAGIAGKSGAPVSGSFGNRGKAESLDLGEGIAALESENEALRTTVRKLSRLADSALRRLAPEERADVLRELHGTEARVGEHGSQAQSQRGGGIQSLEPVRLETAR